MLRCRRPEYFLCASLRRLAILPFGGFSVEEFKGITGDKNKETEERIASPILTDADTVIVPAGPLKPWLGLWATG